jgi:hypothetical protein
MIFEKNRSDEGISEIHRASDAVANSVIILCGLVRRCTCSKLIKPAVDEKSGCREDDRADESS